jgi:hypothetical protein
LPPNSKTVKYAVGSQTDPSIAASLANGEGGRGIVDYEYARRRYEWSKRLNLITVLVCVGLGAVALIFGILAYGDWQWLHDHFSGVGETTRWTDAKIQAKLTTSVLLMVGGALGITTFFLGFFKVRKALDEDKTDDIKKWSLITAVTSMLPGLVFGGLLELFVWRAHATEAFTIFGLLGAAPQAAPTPEEAAAAAAPAFDPAAAERTRKAEYEALFASSAPPAASPSPQYGYAPEPSYAQPPPAPQYGYAPQPAYAAAPQPAASAQMDYAYAQAEPAPAEAPVQAPGTQFVQPTGAPICTCGRPMEWVAEYNRYYCYTDDKYEGEA